MWSTMTWPMIEALGQTLYMIAVSGVLSVLLGIPLGVLLYTTRARQILANPWLSRMMGGLTNIIRSIPFIILLVAIVPLTRLIVGTSIGTNAAIVPLTLGAIPFVGRMVENALMEVAPGLIEAGQAMGASAWQIIVKILLPEALPGIINGITVTLVTLVNYSAMAGAVGGGGLGDLAIRYGYQRFDVGVMVFTIAILIILVQWIQMTGDACARHYKR